jgi:hypothetical protein|tara:strand:+ start:745 stop:1020 length:276 start_codon:yes stop_codon:yes gene_type:complete
MDKIQNLKDLEYYADMLLASTLVKNWLEKKPDNKDLQSLANVLVRTTHYIISLQHDLEAYKRASSDYRYDKNKVMLELRELKEKYNNLKDL